MVKAIVLDIGGVVLRTEDPSFRQQLETLYGLPAGGAAQLVFNSPPARASSVGKAPSESIWALVAETLTLTPAELAAFQTQFWAGDQVDQALIAHLQALRPAYQTAFLTNAWEGARQTLAENYGLMEGGTVDHLLISSELGMAKPDLRIYHLLRRRLGCAFREILFVDDFIENIEAAQSLEIQTVHYQPGMNLINQIKSKLT